MAKTNLQIQSFLAANSYRTKTDWDMISAFCKDKAEFSVNIEYDSKDGITASDFIYWYEYGFGAGDIAKVDNSIVIVGRIDFKAATIVGIVSGEEISTKAHEVATECLKMASMDEIEYCQMIIFKNRCQFCWKTLSLIDKHIPRNDDRVIFHGKGIKGLGVVRDVNEITGEVELYCYYIYTTNQCGFTMHEKGICNLQDFIFEPMDNGDLKHSSMNGRSCQRRLNNELKKYGKTWNQSRHRIEPLILKVEIGKHYWYINDKMRLMSSVERGGKLSHDRALAGNYFFSAKIGLTVLEKMIEVGQEYLASPESNQYE